MRGEIKLYIEPNPVRGQVLQDWEKCDKFLQGNSCALGN